MHGSSEIGIDFAGVEGITPSFLDELLAVVSEEVGRRESPLRILITHPPTRLSSKFEAVARAHDLVASSTEGGGWLLLEAKGPKLQPS